ncbi:MAG: hypothetical protein ACR2FM_01540 [Candidatus Saccharimonadales bacterium]
MSSNIKVTAETFGPPTIGIGSVGEVLPRIVNAELKSTYGEGEYHQPSDIEIAALGLDTVIGLRVNTFVRTASSNAPGIIQPHSFMLELQDDGSQKLLEGKYLTRSAATSYKLTPPEALFILGLHFRTLAANKSRFNHV